MIRYGGGLWKDHVVSFPTERGERDSEEGEMLCFFRLEVGHVHSVAFVTGDRPINHVRARVDARWLCSAGGASLWVPGLQPRCSGPVPTPCSCSSAPSAPSDSLKRLFLLVLCAHLTHLLPLPTSQVPNSPPLELVVKFKVLPRL